jgi:hypothetical protein
VVRVKGPKGSASTLGFGGDTYEADKDGVFEVPESAVPELKSHGFAVVPVQPKEEKSKNER